jgi:hypothetical protein
VGSETYLCTSRASKPGVAGKLASCTVSSLGAAPLAPLDVAFMLSGCSSGSLFTTSSFTGTRDEDAGDELWTTMEGGSAFLLVLLWLRKELRRERERASEAGGGDFKRGDTGQ